MRLPKGDWLWPAFWMVPRYEAYGVWPNSGEIDVMESRGNVNYPIDYEVGVEGVMSTLHWGPRYDSDGAPHTSGVKKLSHGTFNDKFHVLGLYWNATTMYTYLDKPSNKVPFYPL